jgi:hypothetical protein
MPRHRVELGRPENHHDAGASGFPLLTWARCGRQHDPAVPLGEINHDSEPNLAVNPANPSQIAASAFTPNPAGLGNAPIFVSTDTGNTWVLNAIVPSDRMTADISLGFGRTSGKLYAGIIRTPIEFVNGHATPRLNILRANSFTGPTPMKVLKNRRGEGVDQPYVEATTGTTGATAGKDIVFVGDNDFNQPNGRTATIDHSRKAGDTSPAFKTVTRVRGGNGDAPSIRSAVHADGTVYGGFSTWWAERVGHSSATSSWFATTPSPEAPAPLPPSSIPATGWPAGAWP